MYAIAQRLSVCLSVSASVTSRGSIKEVDLKVVHILQVFEFEYAIFRTLVQQLTRFQLTQSVARSLCDS